MGRRPYSEDIRTRVVAAVGGGSSRHAAAERFAVSVSSAIRWMKTYVETGSVSPRRGARKRRSPLEPHAAWLLELVTAEADLTLAEIVERLERERGVRTSDSSVDRFFARHNVTFKKNTARRRARTDGRGRSPATLEGRTGQP